MNRYGMLKRANSLFNNSDFAATGLPGPGELKLLEPFHAELPAEVFGPAYVAPRTDSDVHALRRNLLQARALLTQAGWKLAPDGVLRNAGGQALEFEFLTPTGQDWDPRMNPWRRNLDKLGIRIKDRKVDFALYSRRLEEFDFDMTLIATGGFTLPLAADYLSAFGSQAADEKGSNNLRGVKSKAVDSILKAMSSASTLDEFRDAARALDRVVMWNHWQVPELYADYEPMSYWNKFGIPASRPKFFTVDAPPKVDEQIPWPISTWWIKALDKR
jgi:peptide/nickel transport system substrate-binding protein/microcin C transport system substrate-binding protein